MEERRETGKQETPPTPKAAYEAPRLEFVQVHPEELLLLCLKDTPGSCFGTGFTS